MNYERRCVVTECVNCKNMTYTYSGWCNKCAWEAMNYWKAQTESFAAIIRSVATNTVFVKYENDRQERIKRKTKRGTSDD